MLKTIEYKGKWKVKSSRKWLDGILRFSPSTRPVLEIFGSFDLNFISRKSKEIIHGKTLDGVHITLVDSHYGGLRYSNVTHVQNSTYNPSYVLIGQHFRTSDSIKFSSVRFSLFNLLPWLNKTGLKLEVKQGNFTIQYEQPKDITFSTSKACKGKIDFHAPLYGNTDSFDVKEKCQIVLDYPRPRHFLNFIKDIYFFNGFITLNALEQSYATEIIFSTTKKSAKKGDTVTCMYSNPLYSEKYRSRVSGEYLVEYDDIEQEFPAIIQQWFSQYEKMPEVFNLLLSGYRDRLTFTEENFMNACRALETFHRRTQNNHRMDPKDFEVLVSEAENSPLSQKLKKFLLAKLKYGNEPFLSERLHYLIKHFGGQNYRKKLHQDFVNVVVATRNHYTHFSVDEDKKILKGPELYSAYHNLMGLLITSVLKYIGVPNKIVDDAIRAKYPLRQAH